MATTARQQYFADETSLSKEKREFSIADSVQQKIDSVETGAEVNVIEEVKVNGVALVPDANRAVDISMPLVIDSLSSLSTTDALSAKQGKVLYDFIQNIASRGRFLSNWNCATGLPVTNPSTSPYTYMAGDYYTVSTVAAAGGTNYRPDGSSYTIGQASTTVETNTVVVSDMYLYDGTNWVLLSNRQIAVDSSLSTTSTNPVENRVITNALNNKQDTLTVGKGINIDANDAISNTLPGPTVSAIAPTNPIQGDMWYDTTDDTLKTYDGTNWNEVGGDTYTAGENVQINNGVISATDTTYNAGTNITIGDECTTESDMKGPCPSGYHVPVKDEWTSIINAGVTLGAWASGTGVVNLMTYLKLPRAGYRRKQEGSVTSVGSEGQYWVQYDSVDYAKLMYLSSSSYSTTMNEAYACGCSVRPFKNSGVAPDSSWTTLFDGSSVATGAGIFHNASEGIISISADGTTWHTIADKNLGATVVYNYGDTLDATNCGGYFQRGNNYMFPFTGNITTSGTRVNASSYGPGNYYSSDTYVTGYNNWNSVANYNLWGQQTQGTFQDCIHNVISATGGASYTAGTGINIDANNEISNTLPGPTVSATAPSAATEGMLWYDTTNDVLKTYDGTNWNEVGGATYTAGENVQINNGVISATDTTYNAGTNITIQDECTTESDMKGPCPKGYHIPNKGEFDAIVNILKTTFSLAVNATTPETYLKLPMAGAIGYSHYQNVGVNGAYWSSEKKDNGRAYWLCFHSSSFEIIDYAKTYGFSIRPFKNTPIVPDGSWTTLYDGSSVATNAGVFHNATEGIISISGDGTTWYTIADKNVGATVVFNVGDTYSAANCGGYFQWGNNYMFPFGGPISVTNTLVSAAGYGPGNYYYDEYYRLSSNYDDNWDTSNNNNLWGAVTHGTFQDCIHNVISATSSGASYTAGTGISISNDTISADTTVLATQTDLSSKANASDLNTKTFYLSDTSDTTNAQAAYDWYAAGKEPIISLYGCVYTFRAAESGRLIFAGFLSQQNSSSASYVQQDKIYLNHTSGTITSISKVGDVIGGSYLKINQNYSTPYTPQYAGSPATKKYVDDKITASSTAPSSPVEGMLWYDTANDILKVYDGTAWNTIDTNTVYTAGNGINIDSNNEISNTQPGPSVGGTAPQSPSEGDLWYDTTNDVLKTYDGTNWNEVGGGASGGGVLRMANARIVNATSPDVTTIRLYLADNTINEGDMVYGVIDDRSYATGTLYEVKLYNSDGTTLLHTCEYLGNNFSPAAADGGVMGMYLKSGNNKYFVNLPCLEYKAGEGIDISDHRDYSAMQGPCSTGFHIPTKKEWNAVNSAGITMGAWTADDGQWAIEYLFLPPAGYRDFEIGELYSGGSTGYYRTCTCNEDASSNDSYCFRVEDGSFAEIGTGYRSYGYSIRPFKDVPVVPDSSWTRVYSYNTNYGIFHNATLGLVSLSTNGTTWYTLADKNVGATVVYDALDAETDTNCGKLFQWGNNYGFTGPDNSGGISPTSSTQINTSAYGPRNYYSSSTFIVSNPGDTDNEDWSTTRNSNLRGGDTGMQYKRNVITNLGVLSGDNGVTYTIRVSNSAPSGASSTTITLVP